MIELPKYKTIKIKELELKPNYSGDSFAEKEEFYAALKKQEKEINDYCIKKLGENYIQLEYPKRANIKIDGRLRYFHIKEAFYSHNYLCRILISEDKIFSEITLIYQQSVD